MEITPFQKRTAYLWVGGIGSFLSVSYLALSFQLPIGSLARPGAAVFPILVGVILLFSSLVTMWEGWQMERSLQVELPSGSARNRLLVMIGLLAGYFAILPWAGQLISCTLFLILLMRLLWRLSWPRTLAYSVIMSLALYFVFIFLLKVPMPRGILVF